MGRRGSSCVGRPNAMRAGVGRTLSSLYLATVLIPDLLGQEVSQEACSTSELGQVTAAVINPNCCPRSACDDVPQQCTYRCSQVFLPFYERCGSTLEVTAEVRQKLDNLHSACRQREPVCIDDASWRESSGGALTCDDYAPGRMWHSHCMYDTGHVLEAGQVISVLGACPQACKGLCSAQAEGDTLSIETTGSDYAVQIDSDDARSIAAQWFRFDASAGIDYTIRATAATPGRLVYWKLYDTTGTQLLLSAAGRRDNPATVRRWSNRLATGEYSLVVYSPQGQNDIRLNISPVDAEVLASEAVPIDIGISTHIQTTCEMATCLQAVNGGQPSAAAALKFSAVAGRTYNFTVSVGSQSGLHFEATISPSQATGNPNIWASADNRFDYSLGHWQPKGSRPGTPPANTFVMEYQDYPGEQSFSWVVSNFSSSNQLRVSNFLTCVQCPGAGDYNLRFTGNCAVPNFADMYAETRCLSDAVVQMRNCDNCQIVELVEFDVYLTLPTVSFSDTESIGTLTDSMPHDPTAAATAGADIDEQELQEQMAQMFQHQTLPVIAFPTHISHLQPLGGSEF